MDINHTAPVASVIIAVYNHFEWLRLILDALRMQTEKNFEVIIADDGSNEETVENIKRYIAQHPKSCLIVPRYALMLHRCHPRLPFDSPENKAILQRNTDNHATRIKNGLIKEE